MEDNKSSEMAPNVDQKKREQKRFGGAGAAFDKKTNGLEKTKNSVPL